MMYWQLIQKDSVIPIRYNSVSLITIWLSQFANGSYLNFHQSSLLIAQWNVSTLIFFSRIYTSSLGTLRLFMMISTTSGHIGINYLLKWLIVILHSRRNWYAVTPCHGLHQKLFKLLTQEIVCIENLIRTKRLKIGTELRYMLKTFCSQVILH